MVAYCNTLMLSVYAEISFVGTRFNDKWLDEGTFTAGCVATLVHLLVLMQGVIYAKPR